jgi:hypothetical protein
MLAVSTIPLVVSSDRPSDLLFQDYIPDDPIDTFTRKVPHHVGSFLNGVKPRQTPVNHDLNRVVLSSFNLRSLELAHPPIICKSTTLHYVNKATPPTTISC